MSPPSLSILADRVRQTIRRDPIGWASTCGINLRPYQRSIALAIGRIESLHRSRKVIYDNQTTLDKALDELKYIPVEED